MFSDLARYCIIITVVKSVVDFEGYLFVSMSLEELSKSSSHTREGAFKALDTINLYLGFNTKNSEKEW